MKVLEYVRMVLWSFFGIRARGGADIEFETMRPRILITIALLFAAGFAAALFWLAKAAVRWLS